MFREKVMDAERLLQKFKKFDPERIEEIFGSEFILKPPAPGIERAAVERVAIISEAFLPKVDGVSKSAFLTMSYLKQTGREVLVFAPDIAPKSIGDTRVVPLPSFGFPRVPETRVAFPNLRIARELHKFKPDLIHLFSPAFMAVSGMANGRYMNVPVIANYQTDLPGYARIYGLGFLAGLTNAWLRYIHNGCHLTLVPSNDTGAKLHNEGYKRLRSWGRGVDSERFHPDKRTRQLREMLLNGRDPDSLLCVYVGRLAQEKRVDLLLETARTSGVSLAIIGDGAQREELERQFAGTGTYFTGYMLGDDLPAAFASADVFLFTGPNETFGQVVQEAMASGLPTIVTNKGGVKNLVIDGQTGYICPDNERAFADAVVRLRDNPALRRQLSHKARQMAEKRPWEAIMAQLEDHYREAVALNERFVCVFGRTNYYQLRQIPIKLFGYRRRV
jgi:phosphatidylinositol alpha 1,6-mannosyltransferase